MVAIETTTIKDEYIAKGISHTVFAAEHNIPESLALAIFKSISVGAYTGAFVRLD